MDRPDTMNRREFLHPKKLARSAGQLTGVLRDVAHVSRPPVPTQFAVLRIAHRAMATEFELIFPYGCPDATALADQAFAEIDHLESQLSVYRESSEVSRLNRAAGMAAVPIEERLFELLQLSACLTVETGGSFDIASGVLIKLWGMFRGPRRVPIAEEIAEAMTRVGMKHVRLSAANRSVQFLRPGLEINLGSIGKGYALDRAAELLLANSDMNSALLHGGHSSVLAIGAEPGDERGWLVSIRHPWNPDQGLAAVRLRDRALGTSAATFQHLEYKGRKLGHILDPRTGWPAEGIASASAVADTAAEADALATAFFVQGAEWTRAYCESHPGIGAIILPAGPSCEPLAFGLSPVECTLTHKE